MYQVEVTFRGSTNFTTLNNKCKTFTKARVLAEKVNDWWNAQSVRVLDGNGEIVWSNY